MYYVDFYLRHPAYRDYPVVGVNWLQANDYCAWRTDRVNEIILIREGLFEHYPNQINEDNFNTEAYVLGQYESGKRIDGIPDLNPNKEYRNATIEDGILLPKYRLPTEAEWEYAAYGLIGNTIDELIPDKKLYPWNGHAVRNSNEKYIGQILANFKRGRGDNMGVAGKLNDNADITAPVYAYWPNDYGLYNMAGNVSEWVNGSYSTSSYEFMSSINPSVNDENNQRKVVRGGSWKDVAYYLQVSSRDYEYADSARSYIGFRTVQDYMGTEVTKNAKNK